MHDTGILLALHRCFFKSRLSLGGLGGAREKAQAIPIRIHHQHVTDVRTERIGRRLRDWNSSLPELRIALIYVRYVEVHQTTELAVA